MAKIERFEDIIAWQKAMELCDLVYKSTNTDSFSRDYALKDQIRKSAISVPSNIAEGFEREGNNQFIYFLLTAKASCGELRTQIHIAQNNNYINETEFQKLYSLTIEVSKMISGFVSYLRANKKTKPKLSQLS